MKGKQEQTIGPPKVSTPVHEVDAVSAASSFGNKDGLLAVVLERKDSIPVSSPIGRNQSENGVAGNVCLLPIHRSVKQMSTKKEKLSEKSTHTIGYSRRTSFKKARKSVNTIN